MDADRPGAGSPGAIPGFLHSIGRFKILAVLGQGAFGTVYHAFDQLLDREVALKIPRFRPTDQKMMERFHREAKSAARLHHPNIVSLFEHGQTEAGPYLASEYIDGETLYQVFKKRQFDLRTAVDWIRQIAVALDYAHSEGVVHRDIKPGNIILNKAGRPQVTDFGLAKRDVDENSHVTVEGQILGTPAYMSPEQARGLVKVTGPRSDQYSVGVMLYEVLCGCTPFSGDPEVVLLRVRNWADLPAAPRSIRPDIPRDLEACCLKAIEKDPQRRYETLKALADDLDCWLNGQALSVRPIGRIEQFARWCRHNRGIATVSGLLASILVVLAIVGPLGAYKYQRLALKAEADADAANAARLETERVLIDNYTEAGLAADRRGDPQGAILLFAKGVESATNHPELEKHNRIRVQSWLNQLPIPIVAVPQPTDWNKSLEYHPSGNAILSVAGSSDATWLDLPTGSVKPLPLPVPITAATWSPDGKVLAVASKDSVAILEYPAGTIREEWAVAESISTLRFSPDSALLLTGGESFVQVRDLARRADRCDSVQVGSRVLALECAPDSRRFALRTLDGRILCYAIPAEAGPAEALLDPQPAVSEGEILPLFIDNDRLIVVDSSEKAVRCWDLSERRVLWEQPAERVLCMALSHDRRWLAIGENSDVLLLDVTSDDPFRRRIGHRNLLHGLAFDPTGNVLATTGNDHAVRFYDVSSGELAFAPIPHNVAAHRCVWAPDGSTFATVNWRGRLLRVWKPQQASAVALMAPDSAGGPFIRLSHKGDRWLSCGFDGWRDRRRLQIVDAVTARGLGTLISEAGFISDADFVPDSTWIVLAGGNPADAARMMFKDQSPDSAGFIRILDSETGRQVFPDIETPAQPVAVRVSADGATAIVLCHRGQLLLVDIKRGAIRNQVIALGGHEATHGYVIRDRIRLSPRGNTFAAWGSRHEVEVRDLNSGQLKHSLSHDRDFIHDVQYSPDGSQVATCSSDHTVRLWDAESGAPIGKPLHHPGWIFNAQFSQDGKRLLTACDDGHARVWDVSSGAAILATPEHADQVFGVCLLPGERFFLACDRSGQLTAWDTEFGKMIAPARSLGKMVYQLSLSGSGDEVIAAGRIHPSQVFRWSDWIIERDLPLSREEILLLGEIVSAQTVRKGGAVTSLTPSEWLERWDRFQDHHSLREIVERDR